MDNTIARSRAEASFKAALASETAFQIAQEECRQRHAAAMANMARLKSERLAREELQHLARDEKEPRK
jgi:hypothetical protein